MSKESQAPGASLESAIELIEAKSAQEFVSAMEARGDFVVNYTTIEINQSDYMDRYYFLAH